jgi:hypothetical protein
MACPGFRSAATLNSKTARTGFGETAPARLIACAADSVSSLMTLSGGRNGKDETGGKRGNTHGQTPIEIVSRAARASSGGKANASRRCKFKPGRDFAG